MLKNTEKVDMWIKLLALGERIAPGEWRDLREFAMRGAALPEVAGFKWVPCSERTPDVGGHLWAILTKKMHNGVNTGYIPLYEYYSLIDGWATDDDVTHWLDVALPAFPSPQGMSHKEEQ